MFHLHLELVLCLLFYFYFKFKLKPGTDSFLTAVVVDQRASLLALISAILRAVVCGCCCRTTSSDWTAGCTDSSPTPPCSLVETSWAVRFGGMADKGGKEQPQTRTRKRQRHDCKLPSAAYPAARGGQGGRGQVEAYVSRQPRGGSRYRGPSQQQAVLVPTLMLQPQSADSADAADLTAASSSMPCANATVKYATEIGAKRPRSLARTAAVESHPSRGGSKGSGAPAVATFVATFPEAVFLVELRRPPSRGNTSGAVPSSRHGRGPILSSPSVPTPLLISRVSHKCQCSSCRDAASAAVLCRLCPPSHRTGPPRT
ncbi:hypothetical protein THAOC_03784, partial [Thalassiosira oceanica]